MAERVLRSTWWDAARLKRQRMRDKARDHLLERGFCQLTANLLTRAAKGNMQSRYRYPNLNAPPACSRRSPPSATGMSARR